MKVCVFIIIYFEVHIIIPAEFPLPKSASLAVSKLNIYLNIKHANNFGLIWVLYWHGKRYYTWLHIIIIIVVVVNRLPIVNNVILYYNILSYYIIQYLMKPCKVCSKFETHKLQASITPVPCVIVIIRKL